MSLFALISLAVSPTVQDRAVPYTAEVYRPPVVRPFEPPSNFGRVTAEGDGGGDPRRQPIVAPVVVEAYSRSYEHAPSTADTAYDQGVNNAEAAMDARMGPLDGLWRLIDAEGRPILQLSLSDRGPSRPLEGAWRKLDARGALGPIDASERTDAGLGMRLGDAQLTLSPGSQGWTGTLTEAGRSRSVTLIR
ncbi:hypothetical protein IP78_05230 [Brevundimonas sp. AAP58]|uniref:hypothetical protein n=1 Tax=Brevundimonas sp. AAP58 TaxID=1523422 RepID=UPI0006B9471A|nr:hypothetical protein [Brevundimonas sp. AAP58]KPF81337.1 hypothetical protein IP78_05230 [Brevundimonas sp. AAP58]